MTSQCNHASVTERQGDMYYVNGRLQIVVHARCANPFCVLFGQTVRTRIEGDQPTMYMMPPVPFGGVKP